MTDADWDLLALKMAIAAPNMYEQICGFDRDTDYMGDDQHSDHRSTPNWVTEYCDAQRMLGIYPLTNAEANDFTRAVWRLCDAR